MTTVSKVAIAVGALAVTAYFALSGVIFFSDDGGTSNAKYVRDSPQADPGDAAIEDSGGISLPEIPPGMTFAEAEALLELFGGTLAQLDRSPGTALDESKLPASKVRMRAAMLAYMTASKDPSAYDFFRGTYPRLAYFQPGIGETPVGLDEAGPDGQTWGTVIEQEQRALLAELARANR